MFYYNKDTIDEETNIILSNELGKKQLQLPNNNYS